jgi:hypothetical protein
VMLDGNMDVSWWLLMLDENMDVLHVAWWWMCHCWSNVSMYVMPFVWWWMCHCWSVVSMYVIYDVACFVITGLKFGKFWWAELYCWMISNKKVNHWNNGSNIGPSLNCVWWWRHHCHINCHVIVHGGSHVSEPC